MKTRHALFLAALLAAPAAAQDFPSKPLRIVVPNPAGGTVDIIARALAQRMSTALGQNVIVDIRPGGNNIIGTEAVARAPADGHTILLIGTHFVINPLVHKLPYDTFKGFAPVARVASTPILFAVHPSVPAKSLQDLVAMAKAKPGLNYASSTNASGIHLAAEMFKSLAGIDLNYIPYQGGVQAALAVLGGHAEILVAPLSDAAPYIPSGRIRPLAVASPQRFDLAKDIPTVAESGYPGFQAQSWFGAVVPAGTPKPVVARLSAEMLRAAEVPEVKAGFAKLGILPAPMASSEFDDFLRAEMRAFDKIVKQANIKAD